MARKIAARKNMEEYIDYDYLEKLSPEEFKWLTAFNDTHYHGWNKQGWDKDALKGSYSRNNGVNRDLMSNGERSGLGHALEELNNGSTTSFGEWLIDRNHFDAVPASETGKGKSGRKGKKLKRDVGQT